MLIRLSIFTLLTLFFTLTKSLTISFDDSNPLISYTPISSWTISTNNNLFNNTSHSTTNSGSKVEFSFNGVQVIVLGTSTTDIRITLDGTTQDLSASTSTDANTIFRISSLDPNSIHTLLIEKNNNQDELIIDEIKIAYSSNSGLIPALVSNQINVTPTLSPTPVVVVNTVSTSTSSTSPISTILPSSHPNAYPSYTITSNQAGTIAGLTIGLIVGMIIIGFIIYWLILRRRAQLEASKSSSDYKDNELGSSGTFIRPNLSSSSGGVVGGGRVSRDLGRSTSRGTRSGVEMEEVDGGIKNSWGRLVETSKFYGLDDHTSNNDYKISKDSNSTESKEIDQLSKSENFPSSPKATRHSEDLPLPPLPLFTTPPRQTRNSHPSYKVSDSTNSSLSFPSTPSPIREPTTLSSSPSSMDDNSNNTSSRLSAISLPTRSFHVPTSFNPATSKTIQEVPTTSSSTEPIRKDSISGSTGNHNSVNSLRTSILNWDIPWIKKHTEGGIEEVKGVEEIRKEKKEKKITSLRKTLKNRPSYTSQDDYYGHSFNLTDNYRGSSDLKRDSIERNSLEDRY